jgi:hypothetical protein
VDVAAALGRDSDGVGKQLRVLRDCGVVSCQAGEDRRLALFYIPAENRPAPGMLDYGLCTIRFK